MSHPLPSAAPPAAGQAQGPAGGAQGPRFVLHDHRGATRHFDLGLQLGGVLRRWSVPKGLSAEPGVKRLAREAADLPLDAVCFEGSLEDLGTASTLAGRDLSGDVRPWDGGVFDLLEEGPGKLVVDLHGAHTNGVYHMVRTRMGGDVGNWLVFLGQWPPKGGLPATGVTPEGLRRVRGGAGPRLDAA